MARVAGSLLAWTMRGLLALALTLTLTIAAVHSYLPQADGLKAPIIEHLSAALGYPVAAEQLLLKGHGLDIRLILKGVALRDAAGQSALGAEQLRLDIAGPASLIAGSPRIRAVALSGSDVTIRRRADGRLGIAGLDKLADGDGGMQDYFLRHGTLELRDTRLAWQEGAAVRPLPLGEISELRLNSRSPQHRLRIAGSLADGANARLAADPPAATQLTLAAEARWHPGERRASVNIADITLGAGAGIESGRDLTVRAQWDSSGLAASGLLADLDLRLLGRLVEAIPWPRSDMLTDLVDAEVVGHLEDLGFAVRLAEDNAVADWVLAGRVIGLGTSAAGPIPGMSGVNVSIEASPHAGRGQLAATDLQLDLPDLFVAPLALGRVAGDLRWTQTDDDHTVVEVPALLVKNPRIETLAKARLDIPGDGASPQLQLQAHLHEAHVSAIRHYLPDGIMKPQLARWLSRAFEQGRVQRGDLVFVGPLRPLPLDRGRGRFEAQLDIAGVELSYDASWPSVREANGRLRFSDDTLGIKLTGARFLDTAICPAQATITDLGRPKRVLIQGLGDGPLADGLRLIDESPLAERFGRASEQFDASGPMHLGLDLAYPLTKGEPILLRGEITWPGDEAGLAIAGTEVAIEALSGNLVVTMQGLATDRLAGLLWGQPATLRIQPPDGPAPSTTRIEVEGATTVAEMARRFPSPAWSILAGRLPWRLDLRLDPGNLGTDMAPTEWRLTSDLTGTRLDLPRPFGKAAATARELVVSGTPTASGDAMQIAARLGDAGATLALQRGDDGDLRLARGTVDLNGAPPASSSKPGLLVTGSLGELDLMEWVAWWQRSGLSGGSRDESSAGIRELDLQAAQVRIGAVSDEDVAIRALREKRHWQVQLRGAQAAGSATIPIGDADQPLRLALEHLDVAALADAAHGQEGRRRSPSRRGATQWLGDPRKLRPLTVEVDRLMWREQLLGQARVQSYLMPAGLVFDRLQLDGPNATITGSGEWLAEDDGMLQSRLSLRGKSENLDALLETFGQAPVFDAAETTATLALQWPGGPLDFSPIAIAGALSFQIGPGRLLAVEPGLGRILGILNLGAIQRRLALDFRDVYDEGFSFAEIDGRLRLDDGVARIERFQISGPSSDIAITGRANLIQGELDQIVTVTPEISSGVALASAVAGGPLVGAAVYVADQVAGDVLDRLARFQYRVTGPWGAPTIIPQERPGGILASARGGSSAAPGSRGDAETNEDTAEAESEPPSFFLDPP